MLPIVRVPARMGHGDNIDVVLTNAVRHVGGEAVDSQLAAGEPAASGGANLGVRPNQIDVSSRQSIILAFAERVLPRAADPWVHASLDQRQRFQQLFFPEGIAFDGKDLDRTAVTARLQLLAADRRGK